MEIQQIFNPFDHTVSKGGSNWIVIVIVLTIIGMLGYFVYKNKFADGKSALS